MFEVRERGTNRLVGTRKTRNAAMRLRDKLDNAYGSYHYYITEI